ncbi:MAG: hypothetical protein Q9178_004151 [Gyalolechia marmorata]
MCTSNQSLSTSMAAQSTKPPLRQLVDEIVTIKLEPSNKTFYIHKGLLCHHSSVFRTMMEHDWKEKQEGIVTLKDEDPETFQRFMLWLYFGKVIDNEAGETIETVTARQLVDCYILADRRDVPAMQNYIINTYLRKSRTAPPLLHGLQRYIWRSTPEQSHLRRLFVDIMVLRGDIAAEFKDENEKDTYDKSYIVDVLIRKYATPKPISWDELYKKRCDYHIHNEKVPPCLK